jgi:hypothetical protein
MESLKYSNDIGDEITLGKVMSWKEVNGGIYSDHINSFNSIKRKLFLDEIKKFTPICSNQLGIKVLLKSTIKRIDLFDWMLEKDSEIIARCFSQLLNCFFYLLNQKTISLDVDNFALKIWITKKELTDLHRLGFINENKMNNTLNLFELFDSKNVFCHNVSQII